MPPGEIAAFIAKWRNERKLRVLLMSVAAVLITAFSVLFWVGSASADHTAPSVTTVYGEDGKTPTAYVINNNDGTIYFCAITPGETVYSCQQLPNH